VVGECADGAARLAEGVLEDVDEGPGDRLCGTEPRLQVLPEPVQRVRPHVLRVVGGRQ
jgi:hypothetical protein